MFQQLIDALMRMCDYTVAQDSGNRAGALKGWDTRRSGASKKKSSETPTPEFITPEEATRLLSGGFEVLGARGKRVRFGSKLLNHFTGNKSKVDATERLSRLPFAVITVQKPDGIEENQRGRNGRTAYRKSFAAFGILAITDESGEIEDVVTYFPRREDKKARGEDGTSSDCKDTLPRPTFSPTTETHYSISTMGLSTRRYDD